MSEKKPFRRRRLFPRTLEEVMKHATQPMMDKQGKLYSALLRDWVKIVGAERAAVTRPERLQFPAAEASAATLHLTVRPAAAPELAYVLEQMIDQCARYFGYRAVTRIVLHAAHGVFEDAPEILRPLPEPIPAQTTSLPADVPMEMRGVLDRLAKHVASTVVKKN